MKHASGGHLTCHEFCCGHCVVGAIQNALSLLSFSIWISCLVINSPPLCVVLVGLSKEAPPPPPGKWPTLSQSSSYFQGFESWMAKPVGTYPLQQLRASEMVSSGHLDPQGFLAFCPSPGPVLHISCWLPELPHALPIGPFCVWLS